MIDALQLVFALHRTPIHICGCHGRRFPIPASRFVGYETEWKPFQKEVEDQTPKKP